ncbi:MAG: TetR/AcrR family transcriptional regulator, cholesterol catabolism regulator [Acidimicrobiaceae bacterium]
MPRPSRWDEIVRAAAHVFQEKGYDGASLEDIAERVGIWKGSLYHYITSKQDLLLAVVEPIADELLEQTRALQADATLTAPDKLRRVAAVHSAIIATNFNYVAVYLQEVAGRRRSTDWDQRDHEYVLLIADIIVEGVEAGDFAPDLDPHVASLAFLGSLNWMTRWYQPRRDSSAQEVARTITNVLLAGMLSRSAAADQPAADVSRERA